jgi:His/Glu/Gln/Arg/opine family amino acid ABC transporter permease subunit
MEFDFQAIADSHQLVLSGLTWTLTMVFGSLALGVPIGLAACFAKLMMRGPINWIAIGYIEFYRTIPEMVNIFWIYFCLPLIFDVRFSSVASGLLALSLFSGAFLAEIFRAGIQAVPSGQIEAAYANGMPRRWIWAAIILPQAIKLMIPAFISFFTDLVKVSGLLSAIGVGELIYQATVISNQTWKHFEMFTLVGVIYIAIITPLSLAAQHLEARYARNR